ncbi:EamA family transporter [Candidatus Dojkabacteria bacterium]|nr:EamA family transporter [Candidatus Dojkabacteria bacterium]
MKKFGPIFIMVAAAFWALDALSRTELTFTIPTAAIVFLEHVIGFIFLSPFLIKDYKSLKKLSLKDWIILLSMCLLSSVVGTLFFTEALNRSFALNDYATPILLQKIQPVFVVLLSVIFLKEKVNLSFIFWGILAIIGSYLISFGFNPVRLVLDEKEIIFLMAIGASFSWGVGTILSKQILNKLNFMTVTALRFLFAIPFAFIAMVILNQTYNFLTLTGGEISRFVIIGGVTGGALAMYLYYKGLQTTQAKVSTFAELSFPIVSIIIAITALNPFGEPQKLMWSNVLGIFLLLIAIIKISFDRITLVIKKS